MKLTIENGLLYIDNKRFCYAKVNDDGSQVIRSGTRKVSTQYSHVYMGECCPSSLMAAGLQTMISAMSASAAYWAAMGRLSAQCLSAGLSQESKPAKSFQRL